jgi:YfiH family protein
LPEVKAKPQMIENEYLRKSPDGIVYLDYSDFMNLCCGMVLNNKNSPAAYMEDFIIDICRSFDKNARNNNSSHYNLIQLKQQHTNIVINSSDILSMPADGVLTKTRGDILTIRTADCFPVHISDGKTVAILHLGWRSVFAGILANFFHAAIDLNRKKARAIIGPGIGKCCFEVSAEVGLLFDRIYLRKDGDRFFVDLKRLILDELASFGIKYILSSDSCTACSNGRFHSYRQEGAEVKHMISYICLGG